MASVKPKDCGNICQFVIFILATVAGLVILVVALMANSKYSPQSRQQPLVIKTSYFSASNLNLSSNSVSEANWEARLLFGNRHRIFEISIERFESFVFYNSNDAVSCAAVEPIHLGPRRQKLVEIVFNKTGCGGGGEQPFMEDRVLKGIKRDLQNGSLALGLMFNLQVSYKKGPWSWVYQLEPRCPDLDLPFESGSGSGSVAIDEPKACSVPILK